MSPQSIRKQSHFGKKKKEEEERKQNFVSKIRQISVSLCYFKPELPFYWL